MTAPVPFLYVEDNLADVGLMNEGLEELALPLAMHHVGDGELALAFLSTPPESTVPVQFVLLDLNLPRLSGLEVLARLAERAPEAVPPIIVLTTSAREQDVRAAAKELRVHFVIKPLDFLDFLELLRRVSAYAVGGQAITTI